MTDDFDQQKSEQGCVPLVTCTWVGRRRPELLQSVAIFPGVGKTHIAVGVGYRSVQADYRVYYTTADLPAR